MTNIDAKSLIPKIKVEHYGKLTELSDLKELFNEIYNYPFFTSIKNALKFCLHIPLRANSLSLLEWDFIDFDKNIISIPRQNQKNKNLNLGRFKIPLSDEVLNILKDQARISHSYQYIFINDRFTDHIHKDTPTNALRKFNFKDRDTNRNITLHSFRGIFMTYALNHMHEHKVSKQAIQKALDHLHGDKTTLSYSEKTDFLYELNILFSWWSNEILKIKDN